MGTNTSNFQLSTGRRDTEIIDRPAAPATVPTAPQTTKTIDLSSLKLYKLYKHSVVKISDLPQSLSIPTTIKRYNLRGEEVIRL